MEVLIIGFLSGVSIVSGHIILATLLIVLGMVSAKR